MHISNYLNFLKKEVRILDMSTFNGYSFELNTLFIGLDHILKNNLKGWDNIKFAWVFSTGPYFLSTFVWKWKHSA